MKSQSNLDRTWRSKWSFCLNLMCCVLNLFYPLSVYIYINSPQRSHLRVKLPESWAIRILWEESKFLDSKPNLFNQLWQNGENLWREYLWWMWIKLISIWNHFSYFRCLLMYWMIECIFDVSNELIRLQAMPFVNWTIITIKSYFFKFTFHQHWFFCCCCCKNFAHLLFVVVKFVEIENCLQRLSWKRSQSSIIYHLYY